MKKLIISAISAAALLFGFASCSGDLHDMNDAPIVEVPTKIVGAINYDGGNVFSDMVKVDELTSTYTFIYSAGMSAYWGSPSDGVAFKVGYTENGWSTCWGQETAGNTPLADGKGEVICKVQNSENNIAFAGLTAGKTYKITAKAGISSVTVSIEETAGSAAPAESAPVPYYLDGMYLVGDVFKIDGKDNAFAFSTENLIWGASTNKKTGVVTYTKDIKAIAASGELGINDSSWNNKQLGVGVTIAAGAEEAVALNGTAGNFNVTGLTVGKPYRVEISTTPEKVISIKIYEIAQVTLSFKVKGLDEGDSAWINGSIWGDGWPQGWPIKGWNDNDAEKTAGFISAHPAAVADASGVATFDSKWDKTFISKIGDKKSWECKVVYIADGASWDGEGTVKDSGVNLKFDYNVTAGGSYTFVIDAANGWEISVE